MFPNFCYSKAFWILFPIILTSFGSAFGAMYAEINGLEETIHEIDLQVAENNVPALKAEIDTHFEKQDKKIDQLLLQQNTNYKLLCKLAQGDC